MPRLSKIGAAALAAFGWTGLASVSASYLVVAGGGSGANGIGGGGGAGGLLSGTASLNPALSYTVVVGAGGTGSAGANAYVNGNNGSDSSALGVTATGGGYGGTYNSVGGNGGSGGGGGTDNKAGGTGVSGQGYAGGTSNNAYPQQSGGGGGAGAVGANATNSNAGNGGVGVASSITGTSTYYAGGGGGSFNADSTGAVGSGGNGGGSAGGNQVASDPGTANTGGGSGGGGYKSSGGGFFSKGSGNGGSGVVIISYTAPQKFGGGVVTTSGSNVIHTFNTSGTLTPLSSLTASYLIVAGGGGGGSATSGTGGTGAGGAGGLLSGSGLTIDTNSVYVVTVGAGGGVASNAVGTQGTNSSFSAYATSAVGGGYGGKQSNGGAGGSGGGAGYATWTGGTGTSGQGNAGGNTTISVGGGAGGGGAGAAGANAITVDGSSGGVGVASSISGTSTYYAGGGGGGAWTGGSPGSGGNGGGGGGGTNAAIAGVSGTTNTGGGGGGGGGTYSVSGGSGGNGGSGVVIISYAGSTQQMAGGTVTISGGNVIHTFTSSGYLTPIKYVNNSLRFRSSASAYLSRTPSVAGNQKTWTYSAWVKRGILGTLQKILECGSNSSNYATLLFNGPGGGPGADQIDFYSNSGGSMAAYLDTTAVYRDPAAWYHIVFSVDTTQATASNRLKLYVNGVQVTSFTSAVYPTQNTDLFVNGTSLQVIGPSPTLGGGQYFDGYMAEVQLIDGQALTPNSFGTFNSYGVWQPITYGGSYGTNGFYLPFTNKTSTTTLGYDFGPAGNNWTTNNISLTTGSTYDSMTDVPTLTSATAANYAVLNPLDKAPNFTTADGNLSFTPANTSDLYSCRSSIQIPSTGKWIWQVTNTNSAYMITAGLLSGSTALTAQQTVSCAGMTVGAIGTFFSTTQWMNTTTSWSVTNIGNGDTLVIAYDADAGKIWFGRVASGGTTVTWYNTSGTADPSTGTDPRASGITAGGWFAGFGTYYTPSGASANFGQRPFAFTNTPTGFVALNTYNL